MPSSQEPKHEAGTKTPEHLIPAHSFSQPFIIGRIDVLTEDFKKKSLRSQRLIHKFVQYEPDSETAKGWLYHSRASVNPQIFDTFVHAWTCSRMASEILALI